jgi:hypothetical protein
VRKSIKVSKLTDTLIHRTVGGLQQSTNAARLCIPFCVPFFGFPVPGILGNYSKFLQKKGISFHVPFFPRVTFQEFLFAGTMFLQKLVPFLPLLPKFNNSPACRPKMSKRCHTQQHNPQQRISVAALVGRSSYLLPSPPC